MMIRLLDTHQHLVTVMPIVSMRYGLALLNIPDQYRQ